MAKTAIKYKLKWEGPIGHQPYPNLRDIGDINFDGGIVVKDGWYLGVAEYTTQALKKLQDFVNVNDYEFTILNQTDAIAFFGSAISDYPHPLTGVTVTKAEQIQWFTNKLQ